jgi:hypothetical protein
MLRDVLKNEINDAHLLQILRSLGTIPSKRGVTKTLGPKFGKMEYCFLKQITLFSTDINEAAVALTSTG